MTHFTHDTTLLHYCASMPPGRDWAKRIASWGRNPNSRRRSRRGGGRNPDGSRRSDVAEGSRPAGVGGPAAGAVAGGAQGVRTSRREEADHAIRAIREARRGGRRPAAGRAESLSPRPSVMARMRGGA